MDRVSVCYGREDQFERVVAVLARDVGLTNEQADQIKAHHAAGEWTGVTMRIWKAPDGRRVCLQAFAALAPREYAGKLREMWHGVLQVIVSDPRGGHGGYHMKMGGDLSLLDRHFGSLGQAEAYALTLAEIMHAEIA